MGTADTARTLALAQARWSSAMAVAWPLMNRLAERQRDLERAARGVADAHRAAQSAWHDVRSAWDDLADAIQLDAGRSSPAPGAQPEPGR